MWRNYLVTAFRNIYRQKLYSIINILGLATGLAAAILIFLWVQYETSYDRHQSKADRIYKLIQTQHYSTGPLTTHSMPGPLRKDLVNDYPEIVDGFTASTAFVIARNDDKIFTEYAVCAEPGIFRLFDFEVIAGDPEKALEDLNSAVITDEIAQKYFGEEDPMNKVLNINDEFFFTVKAVVKKLPENSTYPVSICLPFKFLEKLGYDLEVYGWNTHTVYVELHPEASMEGVNEKINDFLEIKNTDPEQDIEANIDLFLFPFLKEHLHSYLGRGGNIRFVYIFSAVALFILIIAAINFMNLSTARSSRRSREIGLRKTVGGTRRQLIMQFLGESTLITTLSAMIALLFVYLLLPAFSTLTEKELGIDWSSPVFITGLIVIILFVSLLAGSYPALYLSSFKPITVLKSAQHKGKGGARFRRILVVFQFTLSVILIISTVVVYRQLSYVKNKDIGMNMENVVYMLMRGNMKEKYDLFKNKLLQSPNIHSVTKGTSLPFYVGSNSGSFDWEGKNSDDVVLIGMEWVDYDYIRTLGLKIEEGRFYDESYGTDTAAIVINRTTARVLGMDNPVGKWINYGGNRLTVIGVLEDYHFLPLQYEMSPLAVFLNLDHPNFIYAKIDGKNSSQALAHLEKAWEEVYPNSPFTYTHLDERYERIYNSERRIGDIFRYFSVLAIFITCLGLIGLASYIAEMKTREIGVRKTFGASLQNIFILLSGGFIKWVLLANIIAWPIAWWIMNRWLEDYAYHTKLSWWIFGVAGGISFMLMLATVSFQVIRSANTNPADALRYE